MTAVDASLMTMNLQSLLELVQTGRVDGKAADQAAPEQSMRVSGGMFGPDRAIKERFSFYGKSSFSMNYPGPRSPQS